MVSTRRRIRTILMSRCACARYGLRGVRVGGKSPRSSQTWGSPCHQCPEDVLDDLEAALTRIDSSATHDEPLRQERRCKEILHRRFTRRSPAPFEGGFVFLTGCGVYSFGDSVFRRRQRFRVTCCIQSRHLHAMRVRYGSPHVTSTVADSRSTEGVERAEGPP